MNNPCTNCICNHNENCICLDLRFYNAYQQGKAEERDNILNALANFWGQKNAEEFREWLNDGTDEFYQ